MTGTGTPSACREAAAAALLACTLAGGPAAAQEGEGGAPSTVEIAGLPREAFVERMAARGEALQAARLRWDLSRALIAEGSLAGESAIGAFLLTPRHIFAREPRLYQAYADVPLDIGYGQTISAPHMVARMTSELEVAPDDTVLEVGTGSGYQAAVLSYLTDEVYTVEIIEPLAEETEALYDELIEAGYDPYAEIEQRIGDGYFGWPERAPFDRIIVTAAVDHIPPPLIEQLAAGGQMLIPVGPPMAQVLLEVTKTVGPDGQARIDRRDVYEGRARVRFVPLTREDGQPWSQ
jgi:protein-L-isoaspartate(D-aspartate) O-methyltransferase